MLDKLRHRLAGMIAPASRSLPAEVGTAAVYHDLISRSSSSLPGPRAGDRNALSIPAVWSAVNCYVNTLGCLPLYVAERDSRGGRRPAPNHPAYDLLSLKPNRRSTSMRLRQAWVGHAATRGNGYLEIEWDAKGRTARALHLMDPRDVEPFERDGDIFYHQKSTGEDLPSEDVLHLAMFGWDAVKGYSPIAVGSETLGVATSQRVYQSSLFSNSAQATGHLEVPGKLNTIQENQLRGFWNQTHQGPENAGNLGILSGGAKWVQTSFSPQDAELILGCRFSVEEIARIWNLPLFKLGLAPRTGEEDDIGFYKNSILPWLTAIEQELDLKLLGRVERQSFFTFHDVQALLRGDIAAQTAQDQADIASGVRSINEVRIARGLDPIDHPNADWHLIATNNLTPIEKMGQAAPGPTTQPAVSTPEADRDPAPSTAPPPAAALSSLRDVLADPLARMARRERQAAGRAARGPDFDAWLGTFYGPHAETVAEAIAPALRAVNALRGSTHDAAPLATAMAVESRRELRDLMKTVPPDELPGAVDRLFARWDSERLPAIVEGLVKP